MQVYDGREWNGPGLEPVLTGPPWEHVSVSLLQVGRGFRRLPNWKEMCFVKDLFWEEEECVVQFHPAKADHINLGEVLHLWRLVGEPFPMPPKECV
jgi:hypothetical protein